MVTSAVNITMTSVVNVRTNNGYKKLGPYFFKSDQVKFFFMFLERKECQADRNCAHFYKIKVFRNWRLSKNVNNKSFSPNPTFLQRIFLKNHVNFTKYKMI